MTNDAKQTPYTGAEYEHDIFVSYSHGIEPRSGEDSDLKTWTRELVNKLDEHIGLSSDDPRQPVNVWYDADLRGNVSITDTLKRKVEKSATLLIIMTPYYLSSEWCEKEGEWFENEIKRRSGGIEDVFVVRAMPTDNRNWPDFLRDGLGNTVLGYPFCDETKGKLARPFGWVKPSKSDAKFYEALTNLTSDMADRFDRIREAAHTTSPTREEPAPTESTKWPVLVAPCTEDVQPYSQEIRMLLKQEGCMLLPSLETEIADFTQEDQEQALEIASAFVQLIGTAASRPKGEEIGRVQLLNQRARQHPIEQFLWRDSRIPLDALGSDPKYKQFVESLGDITGRTVPQVADDVIEYLKRGADQGLLAYMEVPSGALDQFDRLKNDIRTNDWVLLPVKAPVRAGIKQIQRDRKSRQFVFRACRAVLLVYCIANQLDWLLDAIVNFLKDIGPIRREGSRTPVPVVIDYVGEAEAVASTEVTIIPWKEGRDASTLWQEIKRLLK